MDLSKFHNPYDFANPINDIELFIGREKELEEIRYYLDHATKAPRPINIAILGSRASGKTSLLNMTAIEAQRKGFCIVRINLDEADAETQLAFFYKLFDGIFTSVCEQGAFGGIKGKTYDIYLDIMNTYIIPGDKTFCPFIFPLQYAKAMQAGNIKAPLSDNIYSNDLIKIRTAVNCPMILLFDECNVLGKSRVHLEKIRNIFMNTSGYMLVFTGTQDLFPLMDDVFSPIIRQFKKINVGEFKNEEETKECIRKPLENIGILPEEIFDFETYKDVSEIHDLSGGRPYEIQLICHMLFRRVQSKRAKNMKLDLSVLEDVRRELETSQDIAIRPILTKIRTLRKKQLSALKLLCACDGCATFNQMWAIEYIFNGNKIWTRDILEQNLQNFMKDGLLKSEKDVIKFSGDDFDKIYAKYFAREQKIPLNFPEFPLEVLWSVRLLTFLKEIEELGKLTGIYLSGIEVDIYSITHEISVENTDRDIFVESPPIIEDIYMLMIDYREKKTIPLVQIKIVLPWLNTYSWYYSQNPNRIEPIESCLNKAQSLIERIKEVGGELIIEKMELPVTPIELLVQKVEKSANERLRKRLAQEHVIKMADAYLEKLNIVEASFHADLAYRYDQPIEPSLSNNLGYFFMSSGDIDKARKLIQAAIDGSNLPFKTALAYYNLGVLEAKTGDYKKACDYINFCIEQITNSDQKDRFCGCLFVPKIINGKLEFQEQKEKPDLLKVSVEAKRSLEILLNIRKVKGSDLFIAI